MAKKISGKSMRKKAITTRQKSARRKNIAVARAARKNSGGKEATGAARLKPKHLKNAGTYSDFANAINKYGSSRKGLKSIARSLSANSRIGGGERGALKNMIYRISQSL